MSSNGRAGSAWTSTSDLSMSDDFSLPMEYSDTSDDFDLREDNVRRVKLERNETGSSTFRSRNDALTKSSRVVRFQPSPPAVHGLSEEDRFADDDDESDENDVESERQRDSKTSFFGKNQVWKLVSNMAHAVHRSPQIHKHKRGKDEQQSCNSDRDVLEYPHHVSLKSSTASVEQSPLLPPRHPNAKSEHGPSYGSDIRIPIGAPDVSQERRSLDALDSSEKHFQANLRTERAIKVAAFLLKDYERGRPPILTADADSVTNFQMALRQLKYSFAWKSCIYLALVALFVSSCFEGTQGNPRLAAMLNFYAIVIFALDMLFTRRLQRKRPETSSAELSSQQQQQSQPQQLNDSNTRLGHIRRSRSQQWHKPLALFLVALSIETTVRLSRGVLATENHRFIWSSILKPLALFYVSTQARDALEALNCIAPIVIRVILMELFLILSFAAMACRLYPDFESFTDLPVAFISLFELSTTVVNPSIWMPMYNISRTAAIFFVLFIVTSVFYLHSLVLSVVFQSYMQAATEVQDRANLDHEDTARLAFLSLQSIDSPDDSENYEEQLGHLVAVKHVRKTLQLLRPHYNAMKINALVEIVDPGEQHYIDYPSFQTKTRQALNASIRSARTTTTFSLIMELVAVFVAIANFLYVILLTSPIETTWLDSIEFPAGCAITLLCIIDLVSRFNPFKGLNYYSSSTRLSGTFDGLAALAALVSIQGIIEHMANRNNRFLLMGRAIDMIRVMRFFTIFREIVRRSAEVLPALVGPIVLVLSAMHIFTYIGMALWGGAIEVGTLGDEIEPLYDLNNFNSYISGLVTMFQVLVVNDWHAIADVFLRAKQYEASHIVYPFFIGANLIGVSILLNVLTAFFVGAFVTKLTKDQDERTDSSTVVKKAREFSIGNSSRAVKRVSLDADTERMRSSLEEKSNSIASAAPEIHEFDVFEREGFGKIMRTVAGSSENEGQFAQQVCDFFAVFESLSPERDKVGYMVCCQQSMNRYGNRRFQTVASDFIQGNVLHAVVSDMHSELLALIPRSQNNDRSLHRVFLHKDDPTRALEISASLLRQQPAMSLFVSRIVDKKR